MIRDKISIRNVKGIASLDIEFEFPESNIIVVTGKNGLGKTSIVESFSLISDPTIFEKSSGLNAIRTNSQIDFHISGFEPFKFLINPKLNALDTKDRLPAGAEVIAELPIPFGKRFEQFSLISQNDSEIKNNIASSNYKEAVELIKFLSQVYSSDKYAELKRTKVKKHDFYFFVLARDYYLREDHLSSGEYFLIQLFRLITSGAKLVLIDEIDVALDAAAQVNLFNAIKPVLNEYGSRLIIISHSLAFMQTVDDGGLYYLESLNGAITLEQKSFGYIKSDLFGFVGYEKYILTEDKILEEFIFYIINCFSIFPYYQYQIIGVAGINQLQNILEKNDSDSIFSDSVNVKCVVDADSFEYISKKYAGRTEIIPSPVMDIEKYIYLNRRALLPDIELPEFQESPDPKRASKTYWKWLTIDKGIRRNALYQLVVDNNQSDAENMAIVIKTFLEKS